jgi:hypothetical protein
MVLGCGEPQSSSSSFAATMLLKNSYAESLFSVTAEIVEGGKTVRTVTPFTNTRIGGYSSQSAPLGDLSPGQNVTFTVTGTSLGQPNRFPPSTPSSSPDSMNSQLAVVYDYDLATANFTINYRWQ